MDEATLSTTVREAEPNLGVPPPASEATDRPLRHAVRGAVLAVWDVGAWAIALAVAAALRYELDVTQIDLPALQLLIVITAALQLLIGGVSQGYRGRYFIGSLDDAVSVSGAIGATGMVVIAMNILLDPTLAPRSVPVIAVPIALLLAVGARVTVRRTRERTDRPDRRSSKRVIVYGAGREGDRLVRSMLVDPECGCLPVALLDDDPRLRRRRIAGIPVVGTREHVTAVATRFSADLLVIVGRSTDAAGIVEMSAAALEAGLEVRLAAPLLELVQPLPAALATPRLVREVSIPAFTGTIDNRAKRVFDIVACSVALFIMLPLLLVIATVLMLTCGKVLYRAQRVGRDGRTFTMFKFTTMVPGDDGPRVTRASDPRITRVGRWLRDTKLNELPQLINVIRGDMSLVGPRPEDPRYAAHYSDRQRRVLAVRPGMTCLSFLEFGDEQVYIERAQPVDTETYYLTELMPGKLDIEMRYVRDRTMRDDLRILARTVVGLVR